MLFVILIFLSPRTGHTLNQPGKFFTPMSESVYFYRRGAAAKEEEIILGKGLLRWAYHSPLGKSLAALLFHHAWPSRLAGWFAASRLSRRRIAPVIRTRYRCDGIRHPVESYPTFNAPPGASNPRPALFSR